VNARIRNLFGLVTALFALLIAFTTYWAVFEADELEANRANKRPLLEEQQIRRGLILARDGQVLARNRAVGESPRFYERTYPEGALFGHPVGYSFVERGRVALEREYNDDLTGKQDEFQSLLDEIRGREREGNDVFTTLDAQAQQVARDGLAGRTGAVVAIEPASGRIRALVSIPGYDPNEIPRRFGDLRRAPRSPLLDRAVQSGYPPGSTMKVVTATAALDSGRYNPNSVVDGKSPKRIGGVPLNNFGNEDFGPITLTTALTNSVNTVWGEVGQKLGKGTMFEYMRRYGFDRKPLIDLPSDEIRASGVYGRRGRVLGPSDAIDIGRVAIGQERLQVTPLQMALVPAGVANGGSLMRPHLVEQIKDRDGRTVRRVKPSEQNRVMKESTAAQLASMMANVVEEGTGTAAALQGISVAGKTGTAEVGTSINQAWFIGFAPVDNPRVAVAVTVERTTGQGGTVAAPIAKSVMESLLRGPS
jgi:peptidoglycan glycosyltransferase